MSQFQTSSNRRAATKPSAMATASPRQHSNGRYMARRLTALAIAVAGIGFFIAGQSASASSDAVSVNFQHVTVQSGDTLWRLAETHAAGQDARDWIASVVTLNGLTSVDIQPGQELALPNN